MDFTTIMVLIASSILSAVIVLVYRLIRKKFFSGIHWLFPISPIAGFFLMYVTSDNDTFWFMLKDVLIWAFIVSMVYVNIRCLILGSKRTIKSGKGFVSELKKEWKIMKPSFKSNKKEDCVNKDDKQK